MINEVETLNIREVNKKEYDQHIQANIVFNTSKFNELNSYKIKKLHYFLFAYFLFSDYKDRFGIIIGEDDKNRWLTPFSAPFGCFESAKKKWEVQQLVGAVESFGTYLSKNSKYVRFILPPAFYALSDITITQNTLLRVGYRVVSQDLNYTFDLNKIRRETYENCLEYNAKKNLRIAIADGLNIRHCETQEEASLAYQIIKHNREFRGFL